MLEVVRMVECGRRIMPIFLGFSPGDLSDEEKVAEWKSKWEVWARSNGRIDVAWWESTLRTLRPLNGLVYNDAIGEVKFRGAIVEEVCKIVEPFHVWDDPHVQGRSRISKLIQVKILETPMSIKGVQVVGLYGVGGIGKTTACKSLCKDLVLEFDGRVCHIEFGNGTSELDRVQEVLKRLAEIDNEFLKDRKLDESWSRLKGLLRVNKVVLAIDNVSSQREICKEVEKYLALEYGQGSVVMVTAHALGVLSSLSIEISNCLEMPKLVEGEARALLVNHAKPKSVVDERIVLECVNRCYFGKGDGNGSKHYHPLSLKVLGSQLIGRHPLDWISQFEDQSYFGEDVQRAMDPGDPGPKGFQVFLSHSGRQKAFVAQLDKDLRARDVHPFFDEDVDKTSLPIGGKVQDRIFKAIENCRVGVVILSEDFFTCTVWPMLELEKMVECKKKIMPVCLGISPEQLFNKSKLEEWISAWKGLEQLRVKINIPNWIGAVEHLREVKGLKLVYRDATGPVKFREEIVKEIRKVAPPRFQWDDSHVRGGARLSKVIQAKLRGIPTAHEGVQVVGLHGVGGIGKTTACKSLCKNLFTEFDGRVCHIEFGADSSERSELERVQKVLKRLTNVDDGFLKDNYKDELYVLKKRGFLEDLGDGTCQIGMHDLWREFAVWETKRGEEEELQWVYEDYVSCGQQQTKSCMSGGGWKKLRHIFIQESRLGSINFSKCLNVTALRLINVYVENRVLDLSHLKSIKSLEIVHPNYDLEPSGTKDYQPIEVSGIGKLFNLAALIWLGIEDKSMSAVEEISCLTNLQILHLKWDLAFGDCESSMSLDLQQQLRYLQDVKVEIPGMVSISGFNSQMKGLQILDLAGCHQLRSCVGVGNVDGLEVLLLSGCRKLKELPNLQKLIRLRILDIHGCELLKALRGLGSLVSLQVLYGGDACLAMKELPSMGKLAKLKVLDLRRCCELKCIPGLDNLVALRELGVNCGWLHGLPDLRNLPRLQKVEIYCSKSDDCKGNCRVSGNVLNLAMFESVSTLEIDGVDHELSNLSKLTTLKSLQLRKCNFERLPHMGSEMILESLTIRDCERLRGWDGMRGLETGPDSLVDTSFDWTLPYLKEIEVKYCESLELPDLRHFPQLWSLSLHDSRGAVYCHAIHMHLETLEVAGSEIKELPDLGNFPFLRSVRIYICKNLTNLAISKPLHVLSHFVLSDCRRLRTVPDTDLFQGLTEFEFQHCGVPLNEHEVQKLRVRGFGNNGDGIFWRGPSSDVVVPPASELKWHADEQAAVDAPNDLAAGPSRLEPCTSQFIPYNESLSEFGKISVPEPALELGSSIGSDREQTKKLNNRKSCCGCLFL